MQQRISAFFSVDITLKESGRGDRKPTKQVWQVWLVAAARCTVTNYVLNVIIYIQKRVFLGADSDRQADKDTSCSNHWVETSVIVPFNIDLFKAHTPFLENIDRNDMYSINIQ